MVVQVDVENPLLHVGACKVRYVASTIRLTFAFIMFSFKAFVNLCPLGCKNGRSTRDYQQILSFVQENTTESMFYFFFLFSASAPTANSTAQVAGVF